MNILGIDSGVEKTGYACLTINRQNNIEKISSGLIYLPKKNAASKRILHFANKIKKIFDFYKPEIIFLEQLFFSKNQKTAIEVAQFQGLILFFAAKNNIEVSLLSPKQIKKVITGFGAADKKNIEKMLYLQLPLEKRKREDDETDAIAVAYAGFLLKIRSF